MGMKERGLTLDNLRVLIIESEPSVRIDVRDALRRFGPELFEASNTDEAKVFLYIIASFSPFFSTLFYQVLLFL